MQRIKIILIAIFLPLIVNAQVVFKTIVPQRNIVVDEPFTVQYCLDDIEKDNEFRRPEFNGLKMVGGPYIYTGSANNNNISKPLRNITFTLVATRPGRFIIDGATAKINGKLIKSERAVIVVISKEDAFRQHSKESSSDYFLQPGEDPIEKMRKNLFMKVIVDRKICYVGQPVVATFKLYSRLESKSDIVKNPGFYGFTVYDIISLNDNISSTETINGKPFDVHTVRTVQLYPLQEGLFAIDPMEVTNKVQFSKSVVTKKTEQEIVEGVFENNDTPADNIVTYENSISTEKITIHVKSLPVAKKPEAFNGATGNFSMEGFLEKDELAKNEDGAFVIVIGGKGNFTQLPAPVIRWPEGIENFEPVIKDSLDKTQAPLRGSRTFRFPFISSKAGYYTIPAVSFSYFNPDSNNYKTISTKPAEVKISFGEKKEFPDKQQAAVARKNNYKPILISGSILLLILLFVMIQLKRKRKQDLNDKILLTKAEDVISLEQLLQPVQFSLVADDGNFYTFLQKSIWEYLNVQLKLSGTKLNKHDLDKAMKEKNMDETQRRNILDILQQCEAAIFTKAEFAHDKQELLDRTRTALEQIKT